MNEGVIVYERNVFLQRKSLTLKFSSCKLIYICTENIAKVRSGTAEKEVKIQHKNKGNSENKKQTSTFKSFVSAMMEHLLPQLG